MESTAVSPKIRRATERGSRVRVTGLSLRSSQPGFAMPSPTSPHTVELLLMMDDEERTAARAMLQRILGNVSEVRDPRMGKLLLAMPAIDETGDDSGVGLLLRWVGIYAAHPADALQQALQVMLQLANSVPAIASADLRARSFGETADPE
jgi:hypothetical protein